MAKKNRNNAASFNSFSSLAALLPPQQPVEEAVEAVASAPSEEVAPTWWRSPSQHQLGEFYPKPKALEVVDPEMLELAAAAPKSGWVRPTEYAPRETQHPAVAEYLMGYHRRCGGAIEFVGQMLDRVLCGLGNWRIWRGELEWYTAHFSPPLGAEAVGRAKFSLGAEGEELWLEAFALAVQRTAEAVAAGHTEALSTPPAGYRHVVSLLEEQILLALGEALPFEAIPAPKASEWTPDADSWMGGFMGR